MSKYIMIALLYPGVCFEDVVLDIVIESSLHNIPYHLALAVAQTESTLNPKVKSNTTSRGTCRGIFQLLDSTAKAHCGLRSEELLDQKLNIKCGIKYLKSRMNLYKEFDLAIAAYNSGSPVMCKTKAQSLKFGCKIGDLINRSYVDKVKSNLALMKRTY